ncbi:hypothetical protein Fmac_009349 [Flemingia macrophylla]|uniref:Uncharacterized protein n=1 Tax=Flemingia macrophylla TaxID=520843 RepID=A0ABD1N026_9FABA
MAVFCRHKSHLSHRLPPPSSVVASPLSSPRTLTSTPLSSPSLTSMSTSFAPRSSSSASSSTSPASTSSTSSPLSAASTPSPVGAPASAIPLSFSNPFFPCNTTSSLSLLLNLKPFPIASLYDLMSELLMDEYVVIKVVIPTAAAPPPLSLPAPAARLNKAIPLHIASRL